MRRRGAALSMIKSSTPLQTPWEPLPCAARGHRSTACHCCAARLCGCAAVRLLSAVRPSTICDAVCCLIIGDHNGGASGAAGWSCVGGGLDAG